MLDYSKPPHEDGNGSIQHFKGSKLDRKLIIMKTKNQGVV